MSIQGKTIVFTGRISKPRYEFQSLVEEHGGIAGSDITRSTDYLVVGEKPGSKLVRATMLGIKIISELEFLALLEDRIEDTEEPLPKEELLKIQEDLVELKCTNCGHTYKQWKKLPDWSTCPVCETLIKPPKCPNCSNEGLWVEDFVLYHCMFCGQWFKAPYSFHSKKTKHLCYWRTIKEDDHGVTKECIACGNRIVLTQSEVENSLNRFKSASSLLLDIQKRNEILKIQFEGEKKVNDWLESLAPEELEELKESLK